MKYNVEFYKGGQFLCEQNVAVPGKIEYKSEWYGDETYGATVETKNPEEIKVRFWAGKLYKDETIEIYKGHGSACWESEFKFRMQVVVRQIST